MKKLMLLVVIAGFAMTGCVKRIGPGEAGIKFNKAGSDKGVQDIALVSGWVFYGPGTEVIIFPTNYQITKWTRDSLEGSENNEEIVFQAEQGESFSADMSVTFKVEREKIPQLYVDFRENDLAVLADGIIRNSVRDGINQISIEYTASELAGPKRNDLHKRAQEVITRDLAEYGIVIKELSFMGDFRYPDKIRNALESATRQIQAAREAEEKVKQIEAEARQREAEAEGKANAARTAAQGAADAEKIKAQGDAEALLIRMKADAEYNEMIQRTMTDRVLKHRQLTKWNGEYPRYMGNGGQGLILNLQ